MLKIYGSMLCKDCVDCVRELSDAGVAFEFLDFARELRFLREFMNLRDRESCFDPVKAGGTIGIPCIVREDGTVSLSWKEFM